MDVMLLTRSGQPMSIEPVSLDEAMPLVPIIWQWDRGWKSAFDEQIRHWLTGRVYRFHLGSTPAESISFLTNFLENAPS